MALFCNECDTEYLEGAKFCPECGSKTPEQLAAESFPNQAKHYVGEAADELWGATKDAYHTGKHIAEDCGSLCAHQSRSEWGDGYYLAENRHGTHP